MFQGLSTALTALYAQQKALETTGNNIANANTEGYSRQRVEMEPTGSTRYAQFFATQSKAGTGVNVVGIERLRDQFLEMRGLQEHANQGELTQLRKTYETVEAAFAEPGENGLQEQLSTFWNSWDTLASGPPNGPERIGVVEQAKTVVAVIQQTAAALDQYVDSSKTQLRTDVSALNAMAVNVADLNKAIRSAVNSGQSPNELMDQRDLLVSKMSDMAGVTTRPTDGGSIEVNVGGVAMVRDDKVNKLQLDDTVNPPVLRWDEDGNDLTVTDGLVANVKGGEMGGIMQSITAIVPKFRTQLDQVASGLITTVNTQHALGKDLSGTTGGPFFSGTNAATIAVDAAIVANPDKIAASGTTEGEFGIENARAMANLMKSPTGPDAVYKKLIDGMGVEAQRSYRQLDIQTNITNSVDASRQSTAGVNLDEEMTNLIRFQKSYNAAAKYLSVMDSVMENLIAMVR